MTSAAAPEAIVVGGGPAGLMAAEILAGAGAAVDLYDSMPTIGRKLLMAGRGGLNLTHTEPLQAFCRRYGAQAEVVGGWLDAFSPDDLRRFASTLGIETFVGSSGRVFPTGLKASPLLRAWIGRLRAAGVRFHLRHRWIGLTADGMSCFERPDGSRHQASAGATVLAFGGASWPRLGSDGQGVAHLAAAGIAAVPFAPANCGFDVAWSPAFLARAEGQPLKSLALAFQGQTARGEIVITRYGLEGGPLYALGAALRQAIATSGRACLLLDLKPDLTTENVQARLLRRGSGSLANTLRKQLGLRGIVSALLHELVSPADRADAGRLARHIKALEVPLCGIQPLARAISSAGGIDFAEVDADLMLRRFPGLFVAGEMLDWEAPTGGYLLQAAFSSGFIAGRGAGRYLQLIQE